MTGLETNGIELYPSIFCGDRLAPCVFANRGTLRLYRLRRSATYGLRYSDGWTSSVRFMSPRKGLILTVRSRGTPSQFHLNFFLLGTEK